MKKLIGLLILFGIWGAMALSALNLDNPKLYQKLKKSALSNIAPLPKEQQKTYKALLKKYPDVLMAFLLSSEENSKLLQANPQDIESHYLYVKKDAQACKENYSLPFYLSYIAKITVSDEPITNYRAVMESLGIGKITQENPDTYVRAREVNLWASKYTQFRPTSGRDQSPLSVINESNLGRCEEGQIFFISAARAAGIPARPASAPWWPHIDNNHAWAEVFAQGQWQYTGEAEYDLRRAWFTGLINKAIMVIAEGAYPDSSEEVLTGDRYTSYINSTCNYANSENASRKIHVTVLDANNKPATNAYLSVMVYNWGMLRPLMQFQLDKEGKKDFTIGSGACFIMAARDSLFDYSYIPMSIKGQEITLYLTKKTFEPLCLNLEYPKPMDITWTVPPEYEAQRKECYDQYKANVALYMEKTYAGLDSLAQQVTLRCRNNQATFLSFYNSAKPDSTFLNFLMATDEKTLWQADRSLFFMMYENWQWVVKNTPTLARDLQYTLVDPVIYFEELSTKPLKSELYQWRSLPLGERYTAIGKYLQKHYKIKPNKAIAGLYPSAYAQEQQYLTNYEYRVLSCSIYRVNGIPAQYVRMPNRVLLYDQTEWKFFDLERCQFMNKEVKSDSVSVQFTFTDDENQILQLKNNRPTVSLYGDGNFFENDLQLDADSLGHFTGYLRPGNYQIQVGYRQSQELTRYYLFPVTIKANKPIIETYCLKGYPRAWVSAQAPYTELISKLPLPTKNTVLLIGDYKREMIQRTAEQIKKTKGTRDLIWLGSAEEKDVADYQVSPIYTEFLNQHKDSENKIITLYYDVKSQTWMMYEGLWQILPDE